MRAEIARREKEITDEGGKEPRLRAVAEKIAEYKSAEPERILADSYRVPAHEMEEIVLNLSPEEHDRKIEEFIGIMNDKGLKNTLAMVEKMEDPHLEDDFHRFLVQYLKKGYPLKGVDERSEIWNDLSFTLYEIALPGMTEREQGKHIKELVSSMEQFYAGMLSVCDEAHPDQHFTIEIADANGSEEFIFYVSVPDSKKDLFEKHALSVFPGSRVKEVSNDYNIFNEGGVSAASYAEIAGDSAYPLKTYDKFDFDPISIVLNSFSKIKKDGQGAALQIVISPAGDKYTKRYSLAMDKISKGAPIKEALDMTAYGPLLKAVGKELKEIGKGLTGMIFGGGGEKKKESQSAIDMSLAAIKEKISSPIVSCDIRIAASAENRSEALKIISEIESAFNQFDNPGFARLKFTRMERRELPEFLEKFSFRAPMPGKSIPLNLREVSSLMHFKEASSAAPELRRASSSTAPAPIDLPKDGVILGVNRDRGRETVVRMSDEDRLRHFYCIGQTGTGKSTLLKNMIVQDIIRGEGVCMIDPHGMDIVDVLASVPRERFNDVIYFDPSHIERPMALNMLEYDVSHPEQKTFVVNEMLAIFNKLFDMKVAGGPMFEQYFRGACMLVIEDPETGNTLLDVSRVLASKSFRELKLSRCKNPIVVQFWREVAEKAGGEAKLENMVPYITSKFDMFLSNDIMRPIIAQEKSSFNFREVMDSKKILLVNLSKGRLGDINANLIGLILVGKILMAALSRADSIGKNMPPFYLYIDEFQNVTTDSISTILSEARKYKLSLTVAHQYISQLEEGIKNAVFGNVGSISAFRVGTDDAEFLEKQFSPVFTAKDISNIENRNAYIKMLVGGRPTKPFNIETLPPPAGNREVIDPLKELSSLTYGRNRAEIEAEVMAKYESMRSQKPAAPMA